jgi:hypothetical protein
MLEEKQRTSSESEFITSDITEDEIKGAASAIYAAGADTVGIFAIPYWHYLPTNKIRLSPRLLSLSSTWFETQKSKRKHGVR